MADVLTRTGGFDFGKDLDTAAGVAVEQVAGADENALGIRVCTEDEDAGVLQIAANDALDVDVLSIARDAGTQAADAADDHLHLNACLRGFDELFHHIHVVERVDLDKDIARMSGAAEVNLLLNVLDDTGLEAVGRDPKALCGIDYLAHAKLLKDMGCILAHLLVGGDEGKVGVQLRGFFVIVAGAHLRDVADLVVYLSGNQAELGMNLVVAQTVDDGAACLFEHGGIIDVALLIEAGTQLQNAQNLLALLGGMGQRRGNLTVVCQAVEGDLDGDHAGVITGFIQQVNERFGAVERKAQQQVVILQIVQRTAGLTFGKVNRHKGLGFPIVPLLLVLARVQSRGKRKAKGKIQRDGAHHDAAWRDLHLLAQEAGVAALSEQAYADRVRKLVEQQRPILVKGLRQAGFTVWEGKANYLLFRSHDATLGKRMEEAGFPMRDCSNYHNLQPGDYRIAVRTEEENRGFLEALFLCQGKGQL